MWCGDWAGQITPYREPVIPLTVGQIYNIRGWQWQIERAYMENFKSRLSSWSACYHWVQNVSLWNYWVTIYRTLTVPAQPQWDVHIVHHKYIYISLLLATYFGFVEKLCKGIKIYVLFSLQHCRMIIWFSQQSKHAARNKLM